MVYNNKRLSDLTTRIQKGGDIPDFEEEVTKLIASLNYEDPVEIDNRMKHCLTRLEEITNYINARMKIAAARQSYMLLRVIKSTIKNCYKTEDIGSRARQSLKFSLLRLLQKGFTYVQGESNYLQNRVLRAILEIMSDRRYWTQPEVVRDQPAVIEFINAIQVELSSWNLTVEVVDTLSPLLLSMPRDLLKIIRVSKIINMLSLRDDRSEIAEVWSALTNTLLDERFPLYEIINQERIDYTCEAAIRFRASVARAEEEDRRDMMAESPFYHPASAVTLIETAMEYTTQHVEVVRFLAFLYLIDPDAQQHAQMMVAKNWKLHTNFRLIPRTWKALARLPYVDKIPHLQVYNEILTTNRLLSFQELINFGFALDKKRIRTTLEAFAENDDEFTMVQLMKIITILFEHCEDYIDTFMKSPKISRAIVDNPLPFTEFICEQQSTFFENGHPIIKAMSQRFERIIDEAVDGTLREFSTSDLLTCLRICGLFPYLFLKESRLDQIVKIIGYEYSVPITKECGVMLEAHVDFAADDGSVEEEPQ